MIVATGGNNFRLDEADEVVNTIRKEMSPEADVIFGAIYENMENKIRVAVMSVSEGKLKDEVLVRNAVSNFFCYREYGLRKEALRMALGSPALNNVHREKAIERISKKIPEVLNYDKSEIFPIRRAS